MGRKGVMTTDYTGQKFFHLTAIEWRGNGRWLFKCDCGNEKETYLAFVRRGAIKSCSCKTKHGYSDTPTYESWVAMRSRCNRPTDSQYRWYGAVGVTICERWNDFRNFLSDMGERPEGLTLDRIDPTGNYEPENCRWADMTTQLRNRRDRKLSMEIGRALRDGSMTVEECVALTGVHPSTARQAKRGGSWI